MDFMEAYKFLSEKTILNETAPAGATEIEELKREVARLKRELAAEKKKNKPKKTTEKARSTNSYSSRSYDRPDYSTCGGSYSSYSSYSSGCGSSGSSC